MNESFLFPVRVTRASADAITASPTIHHVSPCLRVFMELVIESRLPDGPFSFSFPGFRLKRSIAPGAPRKAYVKYYRLWPLHSALSYLTQREPCVGRSALQKEKSLVSVLCISPEHHRITASSTAVTVFIFDILTDGDRNRCCTFAPLLYLTRLSAGKKVWLQWTECISAVDSSLSSSF